MSPDGLPPAGYPVRPHGHVFRSQVSAFSFPFPSTLTKLAFIVSHPIQYYVPLYQRLAARGDLEIRVFYTWRGAEKGAFDQGFQKAIAWDIPLTDGYDFEVVPNIASDPGTHHFMGLRNPDLVRRVLAWRPDAAHLTGYSYASHLKALRSLPGKGVPVLFRGDSHLLDERRSGLRWRAKKLLLSQIFSWPAAFLYVGKANREYYRAFGVPERKLFHCPHSIEIERFAEPDAELEAAAKAWRSKLRVTEQQKVLLFAGKFEEKKQPIQMMKAFLSAGIENAICILVGDGHLGNEVRALAAQHPAQFRVLPFQNQSRMPLVYRLGDCFVLPSAYGETWGLAVNEAMACGRPVLVSNKVGCSADLIPSGRHGEVFACDDWQDFQEKAKALLLSDRIANRESIRQWAKNWSIQQSAEALVECLCRIIT
jgi:glycosyltransferase involved in cell wall biosynthesis